LSLARQALDRLGERDHARHVIVVREGSQQELAGWGARDTVLISRKPFSEGDLARAKAAVAASNMQIVYMPDMRTPGPFAELLQTRDPQAFYESYRYDVSPVTDDRPFFFYTVQPRDLLAFLQGPSGSADYKINRAVPLLFGLVAVSIIATAVILLLPPLVLGTRVPRDRRILVSLLYFLCIGVGYILIQVALIQKFVILLGHPTYALTVIIFSMLLSSGVGSYYSRKLLAGQDERLVRALFAVSLLIAVLAFVAPVVSSAGIAWPLPVKVLATAALIAPAAFFMGMMFPTGLARLERRHPASVRWAWSLNAASSVLGSAGAIFLAIYTGLRATLLIGAVLYLAASAVILLTRTETSTESPAA
ncbi:MAG TPA: hypothetical protein VES20_19485, partial [Bryobacteraceae bacterium]|nr:hypothetical protein [Bryobacteraceae bacterium]